MSRSTTEALVYMANQIARNFIVDGEDKAALETADHIKAFWDPRMLEGIGRADPALLSPAARRAIALVLSPVTVPHQTGATEFANVNDAGHLPSDAG